MPARTGNTYTLPGRGTVNVRQKTFAGKGPGPAGTRKARLATAATTPTAIISSGGRISTSGFGSQQAAGRAAQAARASQGRVRAILRLTTPSPQKGLEQKAPKFTPAPAPQAAPPPKPLPATAKPATFRGHKTAGTPTLAELRGAAKTGTLKVSQKGFAITPQVAQASKAFKVARKAVGRSQPNLAGLSGPEQRADKLDAKIGPKFGIPPSVLMAQQKQESGFNPAAVSSAKAQGISQFIPSTAASYGVEYGTSPKAVRSQIRGEAKLLRDKGFRSNPQAALSAYSGGYAASAYNNPILEGAKAYAALDRAKPDSAAARKLKAAKEQAARLGLRVAKKKGFRYANPLPANAWSPGRSDQGFDAAPKTANAPILAVSKGKVIATGAPGWPEGGGVTYKILQGPQKGKEIFAFEGLNPTVRPGQVVKRGQVIAEGRQGGSIETGYYVGNPTTAGHPLNNQVIGSGQTYSVASTDGSQTVGSAEFEKQILGRAVSVPASGGSAGYFITGPTVSAYASATGESTAEVAAKARSRKLTPAQMFHKLDQMGIGVTPGKESKAAPEPFGPTELERLEAKYGVR